MIKQKQSGGVRPTGREGKKSNLPASRRSLADSKADPGSRDSLDQLACSIYSARRERRRFFDNSLFGEAAWDMLLLLFWAGAHGRGLNPKMLTRSVGAPTATALRWLTILETEGLVVQRHGPSGDLSRTVELTETARSRLTRYLKQFA